MILLHVFIVQNFLKNQNNESHNEIYDLEEDHRNQVDPVKNSRPHCRQPVVWFVILQKVTDLHKIWCKSVTEGKLTFFIYWKILHFIPMRLCHSIRLSYFPIVSFAKQKLQKIRRTPVSSCGKMMQMRIDASNDHSYRNEYEFGHHEYSLRKNCTWRSGLLGVLISELKKSESESEFKFSMTRNRNLNSEPRKPSELDFFFSESKLRTALVASD